MLLWVKLLLSVRPFVFEAERRGIFQSRINDFLAVFDSRCSDVDAWKLVKAGALLSVAAKREVQRQAFVIHWFSESFLIIKTDFSLRLKCFENYLLL